MTKKQNKQFGIWMDTHQATIAGREHTDNGEFKIMGTVKNAGADNNSNENASNNQEITLTQKYFKEITGKMPNIDEIHVTGTGQIQEQFMKYLSQTAQYKNAVCTESTTNRMSDDELLSLVTKHFN
jgi:stalled ribosome rescue protein Dom34